MNLRNKLSGFHALWQFDNRWQLIINRLFFSRDLALLYRRGSVEFLVDHAGGDSSGTRLCIVTDIYKRFLPKMQLGSTLTVFDLGANGGGFPLMLLVNGKRLSRLVCVEMNPNTFQRLQYNIGHNVDGEFTLVNGAVCSSRTKFDLILGNGSTSDSIYQNHSSNSAPSLRKYSIEGYSFDFLFRSHFGESLVDICKMDIEGAEYEVLLSSEHTTLRLCRYLIVEIHPGTSEKRHEIDETLKNMGFIEVDVGDGQTTAERLYRNQN